MSDGGSAMPHGELSNPENLISPTAIQTQPNLINSEEESFENSVASCHSSKVSVRARRKTTVSLGGRESKISELRLSIGKKINSECRFLASTQKVLSEGVTLTALYDIYDDIDSRVGSVCEMYNQLRSLCNDDDNQIPEQAKIMYTSFMSRAEKFKEALEKDMDNQEALEQAVVDAEAEKRYKELEEEDRLFQEFLSTSEEVSTVIIPPPTNEIASQFTDSSPIKASRSAQQEVNTTANTYTQQLPNTSVSPPNHTQNRITQNKMSEPQSQDGEANALTTLIKGFTKALEANNRKSVEPEVFYGDVLKFSDWEVDLDTFLNAERITGNYRLRHLKKYVDGEARKCIESHLTINVDASYDEARTILKERYGNQQVITRNFRKRLSEWPQIKPRDAKALREYSDYLCYLQSAMKYVGNLSILNDCIENEKMAAKLPDWLKLKWPRIVAQEIRTNQRYPTFDKFSEFVKEEAFIMNLDISQNLSQERRQDKKQDQGSENKFFKTFQVAREERHQVLTRCGYCGLKNHPTADCYKLQKLTKEEREKTIQEKGLCFRCLDVGHRSKGCLVRKSCLICQKPHATANHDPNFRTRNPKPLHQFNPGNNSTNVTVPSQDTNLIKSPETLRGTVPETKQLNCRSIGIGSNLTSMIVPVYLSAGTGREILVYAMLDSMSDACYVSTSVIKMLKAKADGIETNVTVHTINGAEQGDLERFDNLMLRGFTTESSAQIKAYKKDHVYCKRDQIPDPERARRVPHLEMIANSIPPPMDIPVGLLIGADHPEVIQPIEIKPAPKGISGLPFGVRTLFGWTMGGGTIYSSSRSTYTFKTNTSTDSMSILERDFRDTGNDNTLKPQDVYSSIPTKAAEFLKKDFYVHHGVTSVETVQEAKESIEATTKICSKSNVRLHKFLSNNKQVLSSVPESECSESTTNLNLVHDQLPQERALGMEWSAETDCFTFALPHFDKPTTKRGLLSTIPRIYDPLGLILPVIPLHNYKLPIIIPKQSHPANLIIKDQHEKIYHLGYKSTLCAIREAGYWLTNSLSTVKSYLREFLPCKRLRNKPAAQQMGNLPEERLEKTAPFTRIRTDVFGPRYVKDRGTENKKWGLVAFCLYSRAIHIETLEEMTTDCLILALRCFMAVRGPVKTIVCDNGTNFVGMRNKLSSQLNLTDAKLNSYLQGNKIEINHNTPKASHQGGVTERMICSIRAVLNGMDIRNKIDTKTLRAILFEVANIVNNRPLTGTLIHDVEEEIMTPNRLLTMKGPLLALPPGDFPTINVYSSKRWKVAQAVADKFWKAWKAEYFETIMHQQKWTDVQGNIKVGDIVSVVDENTARKDWKIGRVSNTFPGKDGLVRNIEITLGNRWLDRKGKPIEPPTVLSRPISKVILLLST